MKDLKFEKPTAVEELSVNGNKGRFVIRPLERGYGITLGNALRRVLLSSLPGAAIVNIKIDCIEHEFSTMEGLYEDVMGIVLNLKKVVFAVDSTEPDFEQKLELYAVGAGKVTAADFNHVDGVEVIFMVLNDGDVHPTYDIGIWVNTPFFASALDQLFDLAWTALKKVKAK